ncbi:unnamed protein product (macronuclear) [Paramecium tetraurelia]|uniref:Shugoshin C-terminal domain-containing protein n=1 Tax=Paramecium tetraurelia TaxID=5888 RepID=A0DRL7_PARTE|nr:uncharacterized protein GSPATT00019402001 [Paramecium tetraurelia]CAK85684.1 unnamed protein product [Paramecium tetraurelia]|eukprot:XP_001453081.1 hypothetical protein (macronuclear) [Paramecium tetraurelia strain d4-2]
MEISRKAQFTIFKKKGASIQTIETIEPTFKKQISPQHTHRLFQSTQSSKSMVINKDKEKQRIKQLLEENMKLLEQCSEKDLQIGRLKANAQRNLDLRTQRVQTLNNLKPNEKKNCYFDNQKTQNISDLEQNDDKQLFTFYSPEQKQVSQTFKLPKVFRAFPKQNRYYI